MITRVFLASSRLLPRRPGFTLIELLVVLAILGTLFALTLAAVHQVRMAVLRTERDHWHRERALGETVRRQLPLKILFIGNSYTDSNDLPGMLVALAKAGNTQPALVVDEHLVGGATLKKHWEEGQALQKIQSTDWDFVVLQEQSQTPLPHFGRDQVFYPYATRFDEAIRARGAIPLFFMTWSRPDTPGPQAWWTESYLGITKKLNAECVPAGIAFEKAKQSLPHVKMYQDSGGHPTPESTYLVACTFYATLFDRSPEGLTNQVTTSQGTTTVPPADAQAMQRFAWKAHQEVKQRLKPEWR